MTDLADRRGVEFDVYEAAEDSALLAGVAEEHASPDSLVLDVGTGSGYVGARVAETTGATVVGSDVNPEACRRAREAGIDAVRADLTEPYRDGAFDLVTFNPPYLPTDPEAEWDDWFETAISGGETGREVIERFLADLGRVLAPDGAALLLVSSLAGVEEVAEVAGECGFSAAAEVDSSFPGETLTVLRLWR